VLHGKNEMKVVVVLNDHPRTHLGCWNCHVFNSLLRTLAVSFLMRLVWFLRELCWQTIGLVFLSLRQ
jgi:hypothetical protein